VPRAEPVLSLYPDKYFDLNVWHFHEKLVKDHRIGPSYTWVKQALPGRPSRAARRMKDNLAVDGLSETFTVQLQMR
jgi:hypothetical protein